MKVYDTLEYKVVKKGNGKFCPRIFKTGYGSVWYIWYNKPSEFDTLEEAIRHLKIEKAFNEEKERLDKEEVVFVLE